MIVPALMLVGLALPAAIGDVTLVIALTSAVALGAHLSGSVDLVLARSLCLAAVAGAIAGNHLRACSRSGCFAPPSAALLISVASVLSVADARELL